MGPNYGLDKGFFVDPALAFPINQFEPVFMLATDQKVCTQVGATFASGVYGLMFLGVAQYAVGYSLNGVVDLTKIATGKVQLDVRVMGVSRMIANGSVSRGTPVNVTAYNSGGSAAAHGLRVQSVTRAAAGAQPAAVIGYAWSSAASAGDQIDVLLTPGATF
jgi:hypothetical protein